MVAPSDQERRPRWKNHPAEEWVFALRGHYCFYRDHTIGTTQCLYWLHTNNVTWVATPEPGWKVVYQKSNLCFLCADTLPSYTSLLTNKLCTNRSFVCQTLAWLREPSCYGVGLTLKKLSFRAVCVLLARLSLTLSFYSWALHQSAVEGDQNQRHAGTKKGLHKSKTTQKSKRQVRKSDPSELRWEHPLVQSQSTSWGGGAGKTNRAKARHNKNKNK